ncbi:hypothetical protein [Streptomyces sp. ST2-7A]|uniref:hypothetical protein n=1 Tax=Streptomyces sp. ST2-7A TaxID=2907214 RepID=UPI001F2F9A29|nr:hypothetical protein [Streptomyces sp. ST2-7A]MCE7082563.1 hypothetical protein [Streptomyces sp. ST2-7A]
MLACVALIGFAGPSVAGPPDPDHHEPGRHEPDHHRGEVIITPVAPHPGGEVRLRVFGCRDGHGTAHSEAFVTEARLGPATGGGLVGEARISSTIAPGSYAVDISCDGRPKAVSGRVTVVPKHGPHPEPPHKPHHPTAPVKAGGGGTADERAPEAGDSSLAAPVASPVGGTGTGPGPLLAVLGALGVAGATGFGMLRRRRAAGGGR